jgi:MFS transporter, ACS family, D-galactonate transporter
MLRPEVRRIRAAGNEGVVMHDGSSTMAAPAVAAHEMELSSTRRWWIVYLLFAASLINYFDRATLSFALPLISAELQLGPSSKGLLLSAFFWSYALMQVPIGWCADRYNLRWVYAGSFVLWSLAQGFTGFAGTLATLILFRVVLGIGESIYLPGGTKIVSVLFARQDRGLPSGLFDFGTRAGLVVGGLVVPWLLLKLAWRTTFALAGFAGLLWVVPWLLVTAPGLGKKTTPDSGAQASGLRPVLGLLRNRNLVGICVGFFCFDYYWYLLVTWLLDYLVTVRHMEILTAGLYSSLPFLVFGIGQPAGGWIADRFVRAGFDETRTRKSIVTVAFAAGLLIIPAARVETVSAAIVLIIGGSLVGLSSANLLVILQGCAPPDQVGTWTGYQNFFGNIAGVLAPMITGFLISRTGSYFPGFALAAIVLVLGTLSYWFIVGDLKERTATSSR